MTSIKGLTSYEAQAKLKSEGPNEIVQPKLESGFQEMQKILLDPMGLMLLGLAALHAIMGKTSDAWILLAAYVPVTAVDVLLELRAQRALRAMHRALSTTANVLRDGEVKQVPIRELVQGDVIIFEEGQSLPADGVVLEASELTVNESSLTGESIPIEKNQNDLFFAGTTLKQGRGLGLIRATGKKTKFGKIAKLLEETEEQQSPLQKKVNHLLKYVLIGALVLAIILFFLQLARGHSWIESLIIAMTFGMASIPEEFPLVFTLYLSLGAWRLSRHGILIRSLPSVEALGNVDVLCTDKTGTLTEGLFQLEEVHQVHPSTSTEQIWQVALMSCEEKAVDAMELAIKEKGSSYLGLISDWKLKWDYPFEKIGKHMSHVWENKKSSETIIAMKGAVEGVLEHCSVNEKERNNILDLANTFAAQGKRLLGLAGKVGPANGDRSHDETDLNFLGLLLFSDPIRNSATEAIKECKKLGIEIKMLTGDHPMTALAVATKTGISHDPSTVFHGDDLRKMTTEQRSYAYLNGAVFTRVLSEQKHEMVQVLKASGKVVAMTGDGINDAPALKLADIGISMGLNATDVARSTAQMILVKNDFKGMVEAIFEGRKIFANLRKSFSYLISFHIPIILLSLIPPFLGWGELLLPIHIVLLELVVHPISAFAFENLPYKENTVEKSLLPARRLFRAIFAGLLVSTIAIVLFKTKSQQIDIVTGRRFAVATVLIGNMFFVFLESGFSLHKRVLLTLMTLLAFILLVFYFEPLARVLYLTP